MSNYIDLPDPIEALRQNGRYLAPKGSGDVLLGFAVLMRNWMSVHVALAVLFLFIFLLGQLIRGALDMYHWVTLSRGRFTVASVTGQSRLPQPLRRSQYLWRSRSIMMPAWVIGTLR